MSPASAERIYRLLLRAYPLAFRAEYEREMLLRRQQAARLALFASLVSVMAARLLFPWMSIFSQLVGFGLPVALLVALYWPRKSSPLGAA